MVKLLASLKTLLFCILFGRFKRNKNSNNVTNKHSFLHTNLYISITLSTLLLNLWPITQANPVLIDHTSFDQIQFGRNIRHMPCIVKKSGRAGVCMFAIDCIKQNGTHLGTCIDRFYFGSCCQVKDESQFALELVDNTIEQNTISNFIHDSTSQQTTLFQKLGGSKIPVPQISNSSLIAPTHPAPSTTTTTTTTASTLSNLITKTSTTTTTTTKPSQKVTIKSTTVKPSTTQQPSKISTFQIISNNNKYTSTEPTTKKNITSSIITNIHITETKKKPIKYKPNLKNNTTMATTISTTAIINKVTESIKKTTSQAPVKTTTKPHTTRPIIQIQTNNATIDKLSTTTTTTATSTNTTKIQPTTIGGTTLAIKNTTTGSTSRPYVTKSTTHRPLLVTKGTTTITTTKTTPTPTTTKPLLIKDTTIKPLYFANSTKTEDATKEATKSSTTAVPTTTQTSTTQAKTTTPKTTTTTTDAPFTSSSTTTASHLAFNKTSDLVTWSNVQTDQVTESDSQQRPAPSEWVVVSTIAPESSNKITTETSESNIITFTEKLTTKAPTTEATSTTDATAFTTEYPMQPEITTTNEFTFPSDSNNLTSTSAEQTPTTVDPFGDVKYKQICGRRNFPEPRIVGGANAAFGRWPWQVSLRQWRTSTYLHKCGAALLNENWAITAAHCVDNVPPSDLLLRLGEYDLAEEDEPYGYQERRVQIVASHPQFDPRTFEYDLALLRFYEPVIFQPNIIPICVPDSDDDFIGQTAFVTGWGRLFEDGPLPSVLQEVAVPVINNTICESMYRAAGYIEHIPHIFICAGWKKGGYDSCEGDSGGPMVLQRESDKRFVLSGVISWGIGCAEANQPGVYTRISEFRDWINQILQF